MDQSSQLVPGGYNDHDFSLSLLRLVELFPAYSHHPGDERLHSPSRREHTNNSN